MNPQAPASTQRLGTANWLVAFHDNAGSTNDLARSLPPWNAVVAAEQDSGRGRYGRRFVSGTGGLWMTAVVPIEGAASRWTGLSLSVGYQLMILLQRMGMPTARLRWPNDLMVHDRKVAGLLIEQGNPATLSVGLGINITNCPWKEDPSLQGTACRLADFLTAAPTPEEMTPPVLDAIAEAHAEISTQGLRTVIANLEPHWKRCAVNVRRHGEPDLAGVFDGLDSQGNLRIQSAGGLQMIPHQNVQQLLEIGTSTQA